jgi:hypothetical protein
MPAAMLLDHRRHPHATRTASSAGSEVS